jgi:hypothetical protein
MFFQLVFSFSLSPIIRKFFKIPQPDIIIFPVNILLLDHCLKTPYAAFMRSNGYQCLTPGFSGGALAPSTASFHDTEKGSIILPASNFASRQNCYNAKFDSASSPRLLIKGRAP